ncbi:MAG: hypothetical protein B7Y73_00375 [Acidocella sp. 35-58-6]|nr:MAG: hypothetical protein B7Y73_00375 [Acidocella sp. 35-58-6]
MDTKFAAFVDRLHPAYLNLLSKSPVTGGAKPNYGVGDQAAKRGIYLFTEQGRHLYVGRSNRLFQRYKNHWGPSKTEREAAFAFKLAREATGFLKATYKKGEGSRKHLALDATFGKAFIEAKERIRAMDYRWVEEKDPTCQCLLEIYAAVCLETPYNDFDTH